MDAVYVLGTGSRWDNWELRYSLRSLAKYITGIDRVVVVGPRPAWLQDNVLHLPWEDKFQNKELNIMQKVYVGIAKRESFGRFVHLHDDHFALAPWDASQVPNWAGQDLKELVKSIKPSNPYRQAVLNTIEALDARGLPTLNFDIHTPIIYSGLLFEQVMEEYDWGTRRGFVVKSLYANTLRLPATTLADCKLNQPTSLRKAVEVLKGRPWWSVGDRALESVAPLLAALYPDPSPWER